MAKYQMHEILNQIYDDTSKGLLTSSLGKHLYNQLIGATLDVDREVVLDTHGLTYVDIWVETTSSTTITVDFSNDNTNWITHTTVTGTSYKDTLISGFRYVRVRVSGVADPSQTTTIIVCSKGV